MEEPAASESPEDQFPIMKSEEAGSRKRLKGDRKESGGL